MIEPYRIAEENKEAYTQLCQKFLQSKGLFQCQHRDWISKVDLEENAKESDEMRDTEEREDKKVDKKTLTHTPKKLKIEKKPSFSSEADPDLNETIISGTVDFKSLQKKVVANINTSAKLDFNALQSIDPKTVWESGVPSPTDEVLVQVCKKCEKLGDDVVKTVCTLLILPKLYQLKSKLATSTCDAMTDFMRWHPSTTVAQALVPLLQYCPNMQEQHRDALAQLIQECSSSLVTQLLSAVSTRESTSDIDIQIFQLLCERANHQAQATHNATLTYLAKASETHKTSIKFGHCLLFVVKKMGAVMQDREGLHHIVNNHSSSLKKAIEVQLKKIDRNR
ncbi:uncharacterized protein LOC119572294 [Penaeus monodon]|uniref:uncharacterized protein LOC119572294 n=1 Tax=Penaeus monodon TaxID=6687 RepID=UPI0018A7697F|nr:uncharacterized protein LOC119572294 [Penaeus monodon]